MTKINEFENFNLNCVKDVVDSRDFISIDQPNLLREITTPDIIDYTPEMSPVKHQGKLGSCVGFAVVAMKEWQEQQEHLKESKDGKLYKRKKEHYDLSEQWLYYKTKEIDGMPNTQGTSIRYALKVLSKIGVPVESAWRYDDINIGEPERWSTMIARWAIGGKYYRLMTPESIISALKNNGPLPIAVGCYKEIFNVDKTGIVLYPKDTKTSYGGHAVCVVGWNPITRLFKIKNSWGTQWGENGYGYLSYDYIKYFCWDAWMVKDLSITKNMIKNQ
jgi:C1A family cysteine protease